MQQAGEGGSIEIVVDPPGQALDAVKHLGGQAPFPMRLPCHEQQALIAEEGYPARRF
jgi:hypothetical protein